MTPKPFSSQNFPTDSKKLFGMHKVMPDYPIRLDMLTYFSVNSWISTYFDLIFAKKRI
jgi:hypothetical protein